MPLVNEEDIRQPENETFTSSRKYFYIAGILLLFIISGTIFYRSKYSKKKKSTPVTKTREEKLSVIESHIDRKQPEIPEYQVTQEKRQDFETTLTRTADYYDCLLYTSQRMGTSENGMDEKKYHYSRYLEKPTNKTLF